MLYILNKQNYDKLSWFSEDLKQALDNQAFFMFFFIQNSKDGKTDFKNFKEFLSKITS